MMRSPPISFGANSVKARIVLLAVLTCVLLAAAASGFIYLLRNTESAQIGGSERRLASLAQTLAQDYAAQSRYAAQANRPLALSSPRDPGSDQVLSLMTSVVLQHEIGIEGGFYSAADDDLLGYAFPTHEGPGLKKDIPAKERPAITDLARKAAITGQPQSLRFSGARDAIVFVASPVKIDGSVPGSTWLMQRLPGVNSGRNLQLLFGSISFALAAFVCALVAFLITAQVQAGVGAVLARLGSLQQDLSGARTAQPQLAEFEQVLAGVDALSLTLKQKIESERRLENRLRHQERLSALGQFAAGIAHELRNPLATIRLRTQMSERAGGNETLARNSKVILEEIERLDTMIERLLYFSRPIRLALEPVDLAALCTDVLRAWSDRLHTAEIDARCDSAGPLMVVADADRIRQVLDNLIGNAIDALHESDRPENRNNDRRIVISARTEEECAVLEVIDNGAGLSAETRSKAFDPFFTTKDHGTGLGLSICYEIVQSHDGDLRLEDHSGGGARATVRLPLGARMESDIENDASQTTGVPSPARTS